jgi:formylglycine-generating enzyme required for sulfatase activity
MHFLRGVILLFAVAICWRGAANCCFGEEPAAVANSIGMKLVPIPAGKFVMGSPPTEPGRRDRETQRTVELSRFHIGQYEVTQAQYARVMGAEPSAFAPSGSQAKKVAGIETADFPVDSVKWAQAAEFCERLSGLAEEKEAGRRYRLPTEAEWEYACRAGTTGLFSFGEDASRLGDHAWIAANSGGRPHPVGQKAPNAWGLRDLYGNVWEWCADGYADDYGRSPVDASSPDRPLRDPQGSADSTLRVIRGGGYASEIPARLRSAARNFDPPSVGDADTGFRVVMIAETD